LSPDRPPGCPRNSPPAPPPLSTRWAPNRCSGQPEYRVPVGRSSRLSADLCRTSETVSPKCPPAPSVAIPASRYHMWAEARRTQGRLGRTLGLVKTAAVLADTRTDDVLKVGADRAVTRFGAAPGTQDLQPNSQRSAAVCRSTRFSISPFRTQVHELSPHRPSGEPTPASGLPARGIDCAEPEGWPGLAAALLAVAYLPSGRPRVRGFSGAASLTASPAATVAAVTPCRRPWLTQPSVTYTATMMNESLTIESSFMIVSSVLIDQILPTLPRRVLPRKEKA
jgi:hypothetical protein